MKQPPRKERRTCEDCGVAMVVDDVDPVPGVCVRCCERRHVRLVVTMEADFASARTPAALLAKHHRGLLDAGYRPAAAAMTIRELADDLGVPVPRAALAAADPAWERRVAAAEAEWGEDED